MTSNVFITGTLGFLGKFFVRALLEGEPDLRLFLLVRGNNTGSAEDRVRAAGLLLPNVTVVPGDATEGDLVEKYCGTGVPPVIHGQDAHAALPPMDEVWHIAGLTVFQESKREQLVQVNVLGTANVLALAQRLQTKRFFHISTAFVAGVCDGPVMEDELLPNPVFRNPYEETKYHGERLVRESAVPWCIIRPSIIMGHSETGEVDSDKMVYGVVRAYHSLAAWVRRDYRDRDGPPPGLCYRVRGELGAAKDLVCADDAVRLMLAVRSSGQPGTTYHCAHPEPTTVGELHKIITSVLDIGYLDMLPAFEPADDPKQKLIDRGVQVYEPYMMRSDPVFDLRNAHALHGWRPAPMERPRLHLLIDRYVDSLREREQAAARQLDTSLDLSRLPDVRQYGDFSLAHETLSRQLEAFRAPGVPGYAAYAVVERTAILVADPVTDQPEPLLRAFAASCRSRALSVAGLQLRRNTAMVLRGLGLAVNKMGIETFIDLRAFDPAMRGGEYQTKHIRNLANVAHRRGLTISERPIDLVSPKEVLGVSNQWITRKKNKGELRLLLREISLVPEPGMRYCFLRMGGRLLGFVFFSPMYAKGRVIGYYADIERYDLDGAALPTGFNAMRYIACEFAKTAKAEGAHVLALGMSPLYDVANSEFNDNPELTRLFQGIYDESELYAFRGIATHKKRYPCRIEEPVFIAAERDTTSESILDVFKGVGLLDG